MKYALDKTFEQNGVWWRVSAIGVGFAIATRCDVEGEPECSAEILKVTI
jgi:hypothetical protein